MSSLEHLALAVLAVGVSVFLYAYIGYPVILWMLSRFRLKQERGIPVAGGWPAVSIVVPAYNEEAQMEGLLQSLLSLDYPQDRLQILVLSDASTDRTDAIVSQFAGTGVELLRMPERGGKTRAENAAIPHLRGDIIVNTDASIRIPPEALKPLIAAFADPTVGVASGRDISVDAAGERGISGESGYVGYEMAVRSLETKVWGIVGASGCFYAIRPEIHGTMLPEHLSRDFAAALVAKEQGFRAISVPEAVCYVPQSTSMRKEYQRKVRTITRGLSTLVYKRSLLNPFRHGAFAWMLFSHKACRWLIPWAALAGLIGLGVLSVFHHSWAILLLGASLAFFLFAWFGWHLGDRSDLPRALGLPGFITMGNLAAAQALIRILKGAQNPMWEPTRRERAG